MLLLPIGSNLLLQACTQTPPGQQVFKQVIKVCETQGSKDLVEEMTVWHREQLEAT